jgi:hypothetical protein
VIESARRVDRAVNGRWWVASFLAKVEQRRADIASVDGAGLIDVRTEKHASAIIKSSPDSSARVVGRSPAKFIEVGAAIESTNISNVDNVVRPNSIRDEAAVSVLENRGTHNPPLAACALRVRLTASLGGDERGSEHAHSKAQEARTRTDLLHVVQTFLPGPPAPPVCTGRPGDASRSSPIALLQAENGTGCGTSH